MNKDIQKLIEESLIFPKILKEQKKFTIIDFFSRRPGGNYVLYFIMLLHERKIECTEEALIYYIPSNVCSKSTLSNIIKDGLDEEILDKIDCKMDHRCKNIIPTEKTVMQWNLWRSLMTKDTSVHNKKN